jgi:soluble lytic murein transglycosylase
LPGFAQSRRKRGNSKKPKPVPCRTGCKPETTAPRLATSTPEDAALQKELGELARALRNAAPGAYDKLAAFAANNTTNVWGARAALALGYDDYSKNHLPQAMSWLAKANADPLLREYTLFWRAQTERAMKRTKDALADFLALENEFPNTALREQLVDALSNTAVEAGKPQDGIDALNSYSGTANKTSLLLDRAQAYRAARQYVRAVKDYQTLLYKFPLSDEAKIAASALPQLQKQLRSEFPYATAEMQEQRAQAFFDAKKWREARAEFQKLESMLKDPANPVRQRAQLRIAQCRVQTKSSLKLISTLKTPDREVDAERLYVLSQFQRSDKKDDAMFATLRELTEKYPASKWADEAWMAEANYYWVQLDRNKAAELYQRVLETFPNSKNDYNAEWRVAWVAYLNRQPDAEDKLQAFLLKYPVSSNTVDAVYWLGRIAERTGNPAHARSFYNKAVERFPQTYFGRAAAARLEKLGPGEENPAPFLDRIPPAPELRPFDEPVPAAAADRWARAQALRTIAFDSSAEQELKNAFFATGSPRFLLEAAQAAFDQGHFGAGMAYARLAVPSFEARKFSDLPLDVWKTLYPLPYQDALRREAEKNGVDPMLVAGLIRQESTFQQDAVSYANAYGLMQLLPKTARLMARQLRLRYATNRLFDPDYNLQLGTHYFRGLIDLTGSPEYALAAYNAGEDRIAAWKSERAYDEVPELVESIPFSQTREYVQIVLRNAELYRMIYGSGGTPAGTQTASSR